MAHQAAMADGVQDGSMEDDTVPSNPPGDAPRSAGLPHQARQGPQTGLLHQAGMGAMDRPGHEYSGEGLAGPPGVFFDAVLRLPALALMVLARLLCQFVKTAFVVFTFADNC